MMKSFSRVGKAASTVQHVRFYSTPRHLLSVNDFSPAEFTKVVRNASAYKEACATGAVPEHLKGSLAGKAIALMFSKRSTRTRVSSESAISIMGGHPMFLGKDDIQLGVSEAYMISLV